ncbi:hypothetical protein QFZ97_004104 [Paraburkholderia youngii]
MSVFDADKIGCHWHVFDPTAAADPVGGFDA